MDDVEDVHLQAVGVHGVLDELELLGVLVGGGEQALARAEQQRVDEQVVTVDQAGVGEAVVQGDAAVDDDRASVGLLEGGDLVEERRMVVSPQFETSLSSVRVVETTYFGMVL